MTRPTPRAVALLAAGLPVALLPALASARLWPLGPAWVMAVVLLGAFEAVLSVPARRLAATLSAPARLAVGETGAAEVVLDAAGTRAPTNVTVLLDLSKELVPQRPSTVVVGGDAPVRVRVPLVPLRRGTASIDRLWLRWTGRLGLLSQSRSLPRTDRIAVVPDVAGARRTALLFETRREFRAGLKTVRYVGEGSEFDAMREHAAGMDTRAISWRASARHRKLVSHEFRAERNHQVVLAIDTGRLMGEPLRGVPKVDHAVRAALSLSHVALRMGDRVGMFAFDERVRAWAPPRGGASQHVVLQRLTADLDYGTGETNFTLGLAELSLRLRRRSLVVFLTDFVDTVTAELMVENVGHLARRHLLVFVALRDRAYADAAHTEPRSLGTLLRAVVAGDLARERELVLRRLGQLGVITVEAAPEDVSADLLRRYVDVKRRERIG